MLVINESQVNEVLTEDNTRLLIKDILEKVATGEVKQILRSVVPLSNNNVFGLMPCYIESSNVFGAKLISVFPKNAMRGLKSHQGSVAIFCNETGTMKAIVDGDAITAMRTAAASAVATDALANKGANQLAILGAGLQGRHHAKAISRVRKIEKISLWDTNYEFAQKVAKDLSESLNISVHAVEHVSDAVKTADIICTVTNSRVPVINKSWLKPSVHINAVGACSPDAREIDADTMAAAKLYVDYKDSTINESGDYLLAIKDGVITEEKSLVNIGDVTLGREEGRIKQDEITLFESLGLASEDIATANYVYSVLSNKGALDEQV